MNIIFDAKDFTTRPRGIVKVTLCLYQACLELMPELRITGLSRKPLAISLPAPIDHLILKPNMHRTAWRFLMFNAYLASHPCSVVHFPSNGFIPRLLTRQNVVMTLHDVIQLTIPNFFANSLGEYRFRKRCQNDINRSRLIFTDSEFSKKEILKNFSVPTEPIVMYDAPSLLPDAHEGAPDVRARGDYFLYSGTYDKRKGLDALIRIFSGLFRERKITGQLVVTGERSYHSEQFKNDMQAAVAAGAVQELGYVSDEELLHLMRGAKALIYPSKYEGFGLPPVDAMNAGCPVITTPFTCLPEVCGDGALYADPDNEKEFGDAILAVSGSESLRKELILKGKKQAGKYSWNRSASVFLEHVLRQQRGKP